MSGQADTPGLPSVRREYARLVNGTARFLDDVAVARPWHVALVRSEHAHAVIEGSNLDDIRRAYGVVGVYTQEELRAVCGSLSVPVEGLEEYTVPDCPPLANEEVCYRGQPIAAIVAVDRRTARDALERVQVQYGLLPEVTDLEGAIQPDAHRCHRTQASNIAYRHGDDRGDVDGIFSRAERVLHQRFMTPRDKPYPLEPRGCIACYLPGDDTLVLWTPSRVPDLLRARLALALEIPESSLRIVVPQVGGDFGLRLHAQPEEAVICALARLLAPRPIRWVEERRENLTAAPQGHGQMADLALALRRDGRLEGIRLETLVDAGAFQLLLVPDVPSSALELLAGAYNVQTASFQVTGVLTNAPPTDGLGTAWQGQVTYMVERMLDRASRELELEPLELRRINLRREPPGEAAASGATDLPCLKGVLDALVELSGMDSLRKMRKQRRAAGELFGVGVALSLLPVTGGSTGHWREGGWESARIRLGPAGDVEVFTGASSPGPGLEASYSEIAAAVLGVRADVVRVHRGDTSSCPAGTGSPGGRTVPVGGSALLQAARMIKRRMRTVAAHLLGVAEDYVDQIGSTFLAGEKSVALEDVAKEAYRPASLPGDIPPGLEVTCFHRETTPTRSACGHLCTVSVDPETGTVEVDGYFSVGDFGRVLHAPGVRTRMHGAAARAVGRALLDPPEYQDGEEGLAGTLVHAIPRADQLPDLVWGLTETPAAVNLLQARGVGEAGSAGALPAVVNAVLDALADQGVVHLDVPLTPERLWRCLRRGPGEESSQT